MEWEKLMKRGLETHRETDKNRCQIPWTRSTKAVQQRISGKWVTVPPDPRFERVTCFELPKYVPEATDSFLSLMRVSLQRSLCQNLQVEGKSGPISKRSGLTGKSKETRQRLTILSLHTGRHKRWSRHKSEA